MPYISPDRRRALNIREAEPSNAGELNYLITQQAVRYLERNHEIGYQEYNDILGALEGAKMEVYRRCVAPFEDRKLSINGDVYPVPLTTTGDRPAVVAPRG